MEWYEILIIVLVSLIALAGIIFLIYYFTSVSKKKQIDNEAKGYYKKIIDAVGGLKNIVDVTVNSSRLSLVLNNYDDTNKEGLQKLSDDGIGMVKSSKKITLVVGEMATKYCESIKNELNETK